jgi:acyl-CoA synthetase (AMP-forming)/AMP-acid ligase II
MLNPWIDRNAADRASAHYLEAARNAAGAAHGPEAARADGQPEAARADGQPEAARAGGPSGPGGGFPTPASAGPVPVLDYAGLAAARDGWAHRLEEAGVPAGGRVALRCTDPVGYATALVSIVAAGRVVVPLDPNAPAASHERVLAVARPRATVTGTDVLPEESTSDLHPTGGILLTTSGSTGTPKGVYLDERQLCHVAAQVAGHHRLSPADRGYCSLPLFHINAEVVGLLATLAAGACLVVDGRFHRTGFWELMEARRITWINAVPAILTILADTPAATDTPAAALPLDGRAGAPARRIRFARSASAPLAPGTLRRFEARHGIPVVETYGMTEAASMITANPLDGPRKPGSAGLPVGVELRVVDQHDRRCAAGELGRVQIRGRGVIRGYATAVARSPIRADGWLETGDLGHRDADGYLFLAGRSDDVINRGGEKVHPRLIEDVLQAHPGVRSAVVVGSPDPVLGMRPVAYVIPAVGAAGPGDPAGPAAFEALEGALRDACAAELPPYQRPTEYRPVAELPLGPTGKVARSRVREMALATAVG